MKLSKVVDSIVYVPLETKIYLTNGLLQYVKPYWCAFPGRLFDAKGKYVKQIGKLGGGPGEDTSPWGYMVTYDEKRGLFYTQGNKIIQEREVYRSRKDDTIYKRRHDQWRFFDRPGRYGNS